MINYNNKNIFNYDEIDNNFININEEDDEKNILIYK